MSGMSVAKGMEAVKPVKPENCMKCLRRQCDNTCRDLPAYQAWERNQKKDKQ